MHGARASDIHSPVVKEHPHLTPTASRSPATRTATDDPETQIAFNPPGSLIRAFYPRGGMSHRFRDKNARENSLEFFVSMCGRDSGRDFLRTKTPPIRPIPPWK